MEDDEKARAFRYVALDIHKHYSVVAGVNRDGEEILPACRVEPLDLENWLPKHLLRTDRVVIESTTNAWHVYDLLEPLVTEVLVANPIKVKQIACARVKTDKKDTLILARLLAANLVPTVWVPPKHVRELRQLISHRRRMAGMHTQVVNRMHSVAHRHHLNHPKGKSFQTKNTGWQRDESLSRLEKMQLELDMATRAHLEEQIKRMTRELGRMLMMMSKPAPLAEDRKNHQSLCRVLLEDIAERLVVLLERCKYNRVKMLRLSSSIAARNDVHGLQIVECGLVWPLASKGVVNVADIHYARRQWNSLAPLSIRITPAVPTLVVIEGDLGAHLEMG